MKRLNQAIMVVVELTHACIWTNMMEVVLAFELDWLKSMVDKKDACIRKSQIHPTKDWTNSQIQARTDIDPSQTKAGPN